MKTIKYITLGAFLTIGIFWAALYTSCTKDACKGVACLNGSTCSSGICSTCPKGVGGNNCEIIYRNAYVHTYKGIAMYGIIHADTGNTMQFKAGADSNYTKMTLVWNDTTSSISMPIVLSNSSATGSVFTISNTTVDTFVYTGTGSINETTASVTIIATHPTGPALTIQLNNFTRAY